ncbi:hypothetical protein GCM10007301_19450 [Azorhizobium oxalatiphilum]|uniref:Uncharacterized protein n=1 Tax=Azorhizobium oxalatiphilum TaxID=980631 RepID=A0A917BW61_9HYPH|nr:hypothetical protein GCM10007301_19450 [Azorhizobium oxalatiphilum]
MRRKDMISIAYTNSIMSGLAAAARGGKARPMKMLKATSGVPWRPRLARSRKMMFGGTVAAGAGTDMGQSFRDSRARQLLAYQMDAMPLGGNAGSRMTVARPMCRALMCGATERGPR